MNILVPIKRALDYRLKVRVKPDETGVDLSGAKMSMNPFDEIALEEALQLKEKGVANDVIVCSIGAESVQETLRTALAMGADRAVWIETPSTEDTPCKLASLTIAKLLQKLIEKELGQMVRLVLLGKQAIDDDSNEVGQMLAALLDWPQATFASNVMVNTEKNELTVTREIDGGLETLALTLPAVVTADLRLNEPRYVTLPNIMQAKRKCIDVVSFSSLSVDMSPYHTVQKVTLPVPRSRRKIKIHTVADLLSKLRCEDGVIP